jgi:hypothetical protein
MFEANGSFPVQATRFSVIAEIGPWVYDTIARDSWILLGILLISKLAMQFLAVPDFLEALSSDF